MCQSILFSKEQNEPIHFFNFSTYREWHCGVDKVHKFISRNERASNFTIIKYIVLLLVYSFLTFSPVFYHVTILKKKNVFLVYEEYYLRNSELFQYVLTLLNSYM